MWWMARRPHKRHSSPRNTTCELELNGELRMGKQGVYLVRGGEKLKSLELVPWEQILASLDGSGRGPI